MIVVPKRELNPEKKEKMLEILSDLRDRMREIDALGKKIKTKGTSVSAQRTQHLLEELKVPPLRILKETN